MTDTAIVRSEAAAAAAGEDETFAELDPVHWSELMESLRGTGVASGGAVTPDSPESESVAVATITYRIAGITYQVTGKDVALSDATATGPMSSGEEMWDLIVGTTTPDLVLKAGTPGVPGAIEFPDLDANTVLVAAVRRVFDDTTIAATEILPAQIPSTLEGDHTGPTYQNGHRSYGGRSAGDVFELQGNSADWEDRIEVYSPTRVLPDAVTWDGSGDSDDIQGFMARFDGTLTMDASLWNMGAVHMAGSVIWEQSAGLFGGVQLFRHTATHRNPIGEFLNGATLGNTILSFLDQPAPTAYGPTSGGGAGGFTLPQLTSYNTSPTLRERPGDDIGDPTFDAGTDVWTLTSHGLADGDRVVFTARGTGPTAAFAAYNSTNDTTINNTLYWVVSATANTFQLAATEGGSAITSGSDSSGTWTIAQLGEMVLTNLDGVSVAPTMQQGATVGDRYGVRVFDVTRNGDAADGRLTDQVGIAIAKLAEAGDANVLLRLGATTIEETNDDGNNRAIQDDTGYGWFQDNTLMLVGSGDPASGGGTVAPVGSIYRNTAGSTVSTILYVKHGAGDTAWSPLTG